MQSASRLDPNGLELIAVSAQFFLRLAQKTENSASNQLRYDAEVDASDVAKDFTQLLAV